MESGFPWRKWVQLADRFLGEEANERPLASVLEDGARDAMPHLKIAVRAGFAVAMEKQDGRPLLAGAVTFGNVDDIAPVAAIDPDHTVEKAGFC